MPLESVQVFYEGWGERWLWGTLASTASLSGRPQILFEYSDEAQRRGLELSALRLPLRGPKLRRNFPIHQLGLPGPVYDALPDGWGMLLMDRFLKRRGFNPARISPLMRLTYIGASAMGAMTFEPVSSELQELKEALSLEQLAIGVQTVQSGAGEELLAQLLMVGGSPQGARPKALVYRDPESNMFTTIETPGTEAWLVKFPSQGEHPDVCAVEAVYAECLRAFGIETAETLHFSLPGGHAAFAAKRFDRQAGLRIPMQSLAAFTGADFRVPGSLDYAQFLRATQLCTNDVRQKATAFARVVFNVVFNNRDDHPKNFAYTMSPDGNWQLAPAFDVTFNEGPGGYHQMDVMGEALSISREKLRVLGEVEAELSRHEVDELIERACDLATGFESRAKQQFPEEITAKTLAVIQGRIDDNISRFA